LRQVVFVGSDKFGYIVAASLLIGVGFDNPLLLALAVLGTGTSQYTASRLLPSTSSSSSPTAASAIGGAYRDGLLQ
jgi:hypothetical protein